jgi:hypothetical protein
MSIKDCKLACLLELQRFWRQKDNGQIFEWFVDIAQKNESVYIYPILKWFKHVAKNNSKNL